MTDGANKGASERAKKLAASLEVTNNELDTPIVLEDELEKVNTPVLIKHYRVLVEAITGASPKAEEQNISVLSGVVTDADLEAAGVDKTWLLKIGSIEDIGYREA